MCSKVIVRNLCVLIIHLTLSSGVIKVNDVRFRSDGSVCPWGCNPIQDWTFYHHSLVIKSTFGRNACNCNDMTSWMYTFSVSKDPVMMLTDREIGPLTWTSRWLWFGIDHVMDHVCTIIIIHFRNVERPVILQTVENNTIKYRKVNTSAPWNPTCWMWTHKPSTQSL